MRPLHKFLVIYRFIAKSTMMTNSLPTPDYYDRFDRVDNIFIIQGVQSREDKETVIRNGSGSMRSLIHTVHSHPDSRKSLLGVINVDRYGFNEFLFIIVSLRRLQRFCMSAANNEKEIRIAAIKTATTEN